LRRKNIAACSSSYTVRKEEESFQIIFLLRNKLKHANYYIFLEEILGKVTEMRKKWNPPSWNTSQTFQLAEISSEKVKIG
jgi:hypothetical protein